MLRLLADENFNGDIVRGILFHEPDFQIARVQDIGLINADDPDILAWAAANHRIVLTHDRATMPDHAYQRLAAQQQMRGVFVLNDRFPIGLAIQALLLINACSDQEEWNGLVVHLPL